MCHAVLAVVSNCCPPLKGRFLTRYSPVRHCPLLQLDESSFHRFSFDLHVLSTPPAFVLSQDQTLYKSYLNDRSRLNLYRAICHSLKLFILSFTGNWLNPAPPSFQLHILQCAPVWCFSFRSLFNLQGTRSMRNICYYTALCQLCQALISTFFKFFQRLPAASRSRRLSTTLLLYHTSPLLSILIFTFFNPCLHLH